MLLCFRRVLLTCVSASCLFADPPQPHAGWTLVPGGEDLIANSYWGAVWQQNRSVPGASLAVSNGTMLAVTGNGYFGGVNVLAPQLNTTGDFGVVAAIQAGPGISGLVTLNGSLATGGQYWQGMTELEFGVDAAGNYVAAYWDGTTSGPLVYRTLRGNAAGTPPSGSVTMEMLRQNGQFQFYFNGAAVGSLPDPGLFATGYIFPGFVLFPNQQLQMTQLAFEVPAGDTLAQLIQPVGVAASNPGSDSLGSLAAATGRIFSVAVGPQELALGRSYPVAPLNPRTTPDPLYAQKLLAEFNGIVAAQMYFYITEMAQGILTFDGGDAILADAQANGLPVHCHHLIGPNIYLPSWLVNGGFSKEQLSQILQSHVQAVVSHYKGQCASWDVVNEALDSKGNLVTDAGNVWGHVIGPQYLDLAFQAARQADPDARLYYNDFYTEDMTPKADAVYKLVSGMLQRGVPIDGVGLQAHWIPGNPDPAWQPNHDQLVTNMARLGALGLSTRVSELDARLHLPATDTQLADQAAIYGTTVQACLDSPNCVAINVWGATDATSWVDSFFPGTGAATLFDASFQPKPAYTSVMNMLRAGAPSTSR